MKVRFTEPNMRWACQELGAAYYYHMVDIRYVAREYEGRDDRRELVIVLGCPCCGYADEVYRPRPGVVYATPLKGIAAPSNVHRTRLYPPYRERQGEEAATSREFLAAFREAIEEALKS